MLVAAANASLSYDSTVGAQSLAIGKPHAYLSDTRRDVFTQLGLIPNAPTVRALEDVRAERSRRLGEGKPEAVRLGPLERVERQLLGEATATPLGRHAEHPQVKPLARIASRRSMIDMTGDQLPSDCAMNGVSAGGSTLANCAAVGSHA